MERATLTVDARIGESGSQAGKRWARALDEVLVWGLAGLLMLAVLAFGAVEEWSIFALELGTACLLAVWIIKQLLRGWLDIRLNRLYLPMVSFALLVAAQLAFGRSAYPYVTRYEMLQYCAYGGLFFLSVQCLDSEQRLRRFMTALVVFGSAVALFAVVQSQTFNGKLYWLRTPRDAGLLYGPYVNHNHYAGLMELLAAIPLTMCFMPFVSETRRLLLVAAGIFMASTIFLSQSRGGMLAAAAQAVGLAAIIIVRRQSRAMLASLLGLCLLTFGLLAWLGAGPVIAQLKSLQDPLQDRVAGGRLLIAKDSWPMIKERPWLGWGLGTFTTVYPRYRSFYGNFFVNNAHNDYLQVLVETGVLGLGLVVWFIFLLYRRGLRNLHRWETHPERAFMVAALLGCTGLLVHSFFDFNLHIPANAALFYVLCAVASSRWEAVLAPGQVSR